MQIIETYSTCNINKPGDRPIVVKFDERDDGTVQAYVVDAHEGFAIADYQAAVLTKAEFDALPFDQNDPSVFGDAALLIFCNRTLTALRARIHHAKGEGSRYIEINESRVMQFGIKGFELAVSALVKEGYYVAHRTLTEKPYGGARDEITTYHVYIDWVGL